MPAAPLPPREEERLAELERFEILDTDPERDLDVLVRRAAAVAGVPIAAVSLVDRERQWFKARCGLEVPETPREVAFCAHAILSAQDLFEVEDAREDPRFCDNPLVTGAPNIRFYAGVPLRTASGHALGTLCVVDHVPRRLGDHQRARLRELGREVIEQLDLRRRLRELARPARGEPAEPAAPGLKFGRYTCLYKLGEGASSVVYAAYDQALDRKVALKLIRHRGDRQRRELIRREAQLLARISHPNVVQIYEFGTFGGQDYLVMELVDGVPLSIWQRERERGLHELLDMYVKAGRGLAEAHRVKVVHRDFKPENVLVGADGRPRLADFGLAHLLGSARREPQQVAGTPAYMSPEQFDGAPVDERADQFSLCAALYEAIYGVRPFAGSTLAEVRTRAALGAVARPRHREAASPELHAILLRGLAPAPGERWGSLGELLDRLAALDPRCDPACEGRERRWFVAASAAVVIGTLGLIAYRQAVDATFLTPGRLVRGAVALFVTGLLGALAVQGTLLRNEFHRKMIAVLLFELGISLAAHAITALAGLPPGTMLTVALLCSGSCLITAAYFVAPALYVAGAFTGIGAVAIALGAPRISTALLASALSYLAFAYAWTRAANAARRIRPDRPGAGRGESGEESLEVSRSLDGRLGGSATA